MKLTCSKCGKDITHDKDRLCVMTVRPELKPDEPAEERDFCQACGEKWVAEEA